MKGSEIVTAARLVLNDPAGGLLRWTDAEFALWITYGISFIGVHRPDALSVNATATLAAGSKQSIAGLATPGVRLLDILSLRLVDRETLDAHAPNWRSDAQGVPESFFYEPRDPKTFWVHPPSTAAYSLTDVLYVRNPPELLAANLATQELVVDDIYRDPLLNYVLYRAYGKDAGETHNANLASLYLRAASEALGVKTKADFSQSPDANNSGGKVEAGATVGGV